MSGLTYLSIFSGIEAVSCAVRPLGFTPLAFSEIDDFPSAVLAKRFPDVTNLGDITKVDWSPYRGAADVCFGGPPCQSFSIAGGRESLSGASRLMFEYLRCLDEVRPRAFVFENVPGILSTRDNAFGQLLEEVDKLGYRDVAWRVFDAQFFGVAQRRQRVILVGHLGYGLRSAAVLFEPESLRGNSSSVREKRKELARAVGRGVEDDHAYAFKVRTGKDTYTKPDGSIGTAGKGALVSDDVAFTLATSQDQTIAFRSGSVAACMSSGQANAEITTDDMSPTLTCLHEQPIVFDRASFNQGENAKFIPHVYRDEVMVPLVAKGPHGVAYMDEISDQDAPSAAVTISDGSSWVVRRLTPMECERLQGFPDGWTDIGEWVDSKGKRRKSSDFVRYKAVGNSMCVPLMAWVGRRLLEVDG